MAEVSVDQCGEITVHKIVCAIDYGETIHPDQIKAQVETGIIMGMSAALYEKLKFTNGGLYISNYDYYSLLTMSEVPEIEVHIVKSKHSLGGIGETVYPTVAPAICNAIFKATGVSLQRLPIDQTLMTKA